MNNGDVSQGRRRFLIGATSVVGGIGVVGAAVPFVASWKPSARAEAAGAPVTVNISKLEPGQQITVEWRGRPVWVVRRTPEMNENIAQLDDRVRDPESQNQKQPAYVTGRLRALREEYAILVGICTHLGCSPQFRPEVAPADLGPNWLGGFYCACHGSRYDLAGRVYTNQPAPDHLEIPPHRFDDDVTLTIGLDPEAA